VGRGRTLVASRKDIPIASSEVFPRVLPIPLLNVVQDWNVQQMVTTSNLDLEGVEPAQKLKADGSKFQMFSLILNIRNLGFALWTEMNKI